VVVDHQIDEIELVSRKTAKMRFREKILTYWGYCCAYCAEPLGKNATLDHVFPKVKGGETRESNLVACCLSCNSHKSGHDWKVWFRGRDYWTEAREASIEEYLEQ
jgi:5-methylcytosine-specific restriction endonuclease McrA